MARNYYLILGVPSNASMEEIREAYRRLVKASHPDVSGTDSRERFREVQEAWETLGDTERRRIYDIDLKQAQRRPKPSPESKERRYRARHSSKSFGFAPFEEFLTRSDGSYVATADRQEIHFGLQMTAADAAAGGEVPLRIPLQFCCPACGGSGSDFFFLCPVCRGSGYRSYWRTISFRVPASLRDAGSAPRAARHAAHPADPPRADRYVLNRRALYTKAPATGSR